MDVKNRWNDNQWKDAKLKLYLSMTSFTHDFTFCSKIHSEYHDFERFYFSRIQLFPSHILSLWLYFYLLIVERIELSKQFKQWFWWHHGVDVTLCWWHFLYVNWVLLTGIIGRPFRAGMVQESVQIECHFYWVCYWVPKMICIISY